MVFLTQWRIEVNRLQSDEAVGAMLPNALTVSPRWHIIFLTLEGKNERRT
jgi:hypothetical protein